MVDGRLQRIAFVTGHYAELRGGVTRAVVAPLLLVIGLAGEAMGGSLFMLGVLAVGIIGLLPILNRLMDRRFGRAVSSGDHQKRVFAVCLLAYIVGQRLDSHFTTLVAWTIAGLFDLALLMRALPRRSEERVDVSAS